MTTSLEIPEQGGAERIERVGSFFDQPQNYLKKRGFDIRIRTETVQAFAEDQDYNKILDIGCGDGSLSIPLLNSRRNLTLLDISLNMLALARSHVPSNLAARVDFVKEGFLEAELENASFDLVLCVGVLAHVASPAAVIDRIAMLLKPGGTLILECTDAPHFMSRITWCWNTLAWSLRPPKYKLNLHSASTILDMAKERGFDEIASFRYSLPLPKTGCLFSQSTMYRGIRSVFGDAKHNRNRWLGNEHLFCLRRRRDTSDRATS